MSSDSNNEIRITIPIEVVIRVAASGATVRSATSQPAPPRPAPQEPALRAAIDEARRDDRPYYDEESDRQAAEAYYRDVDLASGDGGALFENLSGLLIRTHRRTFSYAPSQHLYPWVDLREDRSIASIYTEERFAGRDDLESFIQQEFAKEQELRQMEIALEAAVGREAALESDELEAAEQRLGFNCEHVVPQSWYSKREPMRGDLHHLFACETKCNSFRGNTPFGEFAGFGDDLRERESSLEISLEAERSGCGKSESDRFEPANGKGAAARATLYFFLRYPGKIQRNLGDFDQLIEDLRGWSAAEPPSRHEKHRNAAIFEKQGNRNPFIDHPHLAGIVSFPRP